MLITADQIERRSDHKANTGHKLLLLGNHVNPGSEMRGCSKTIMPVNNLDTITITKIMTMVTFTISMIMTALTEQLQPPQQA